MPRYRLPAELGGADVEGEPASDGLIEVVAGPNVVIKLPASILQEVWPKEPYLDDWAVILEPIDNPNHPMVFHRDNERHDRQTFGNDNWWSHDLDKWMTWVEVCSHGVPAPLVVRRENRGRCPICREIRPLKLDGRIKQHGSKRVESACKGTGMFPDDGEVADV